MVRALTSGMVTEVTGAVMRPAIFCEIEFDTGFLRVWSGIGSFSFDSKTWLGVGDLGTISVIQEGSDLTASGITLTLSGIPQDKLDNILDDVRQGNPIRCYLGMLDSSDVLVVDPFKFFDGFTDVAGIEEGAETATLSITGENALIILNKSSERRFTSEDQIFDFAGDLGFDFVPSIQEWNGVWGRGSPIPGGSQSPQPGNPIGPGTPFDPGGPTTGLPGDDPNDPSGDDGGVSDDPLGPGLG